MQQITNRVAAHSHKFVSHSQAPVNAYFEALLETGVDEMTWDTVGDDNVRHRTYVHGWYFAKCAFFCFVRAVLNDFIMVCFFRVSQFFVVGLTNICIAHNGISIQFTVRWHGSLRSTFTAGRSVHQSAEESQRENLPWQPECTLQMNWPSVWEVHAYRCDVYSLVCEVIASAPDEAISNITADSPYWALPMAFEHERIHLETSRYVFSYSSYVVGSPGAILRVMSVYHGA